MTLRGVALRYDEQANGRSSTRWRYDSLNRPNRETYIDGTFDSYAYDVVGNTQSLTDAKGQTTPSVCDAAGNLTKIDYPTMIDVTFFTLSVTIPL